MYTYNEAARLAHQAQDVVDRFAVGVIDDSQEVYAALHDSGYVMGLCRAGIPVEDTSFQMACHHLNGFINKYTEV